MTKELSRNSKKWTIAEVDNHKAKKTVKRKQVKSNMLAQAVLNHVEFKCKKNKKNRKTKQKI